MTHKRKKGDQRAFADLTRSEKRTKVDNKSKEHFSDEIRKSAKQKKEELKEAEIASVPRSIIVVRGKYKPEPLRNLCADMRKIMLPYTAKDLNDSGKAKVVDYVEFSKQAHVTHLVTLTSSVSLTSLNICRLPNGPTLTFEIQNYCTMKTLRSFFLKELNHQISCDEATFFKDPAICILNNFTSSESHIQLMSLTFQNMFPPVDVKSFKLAHVKRVVLFNYDEDDETIEMRHYGIKKTSDVITPFRLNTLKKNAAKKVSEFKKKLDKVKEELQELYKQRKDMKQKLGSKAEEKIKKAEKIEDLSDPYVSLEADIALKEKSLLYYKEKEAAANKEFMALNSRNEVVAAKAANSDNKFQAEAVEVDDNFEANSRSKVKVRLEEIGPRLTLKLRKVVEGVFTGETIYHALFEDKPADIKEAEKKERDEKKKLKEERRKQQEENVQRKKKEKEDKVEKQKNDFLQKFQETLEKDSELLVDDDEQVDEDVDEDADENDEMFEGDLDLNEMIDDDEEGDDIEVDEDYEKDIDDQDDDEDEE
ncbi:brix domain-containing protein [Naegleria gruberi]|uniref:Brix domain-containing protein n=1 Tax=Naegleria gruberi TaxID=5762 RepID=D2V4Y9_NAEGR|nr:brix domain-containing protein [Naegleria gruberi]EFC48187.1 brix domain-containing protein [Naegleria gruberi]|eukprot:XP_002680931.1 brix domain-containing protein [Naegleria gruberi strain NEG-M]